METLVSKQLKVTIEISKAEIMKSLKRKADEFTSSKENVDNLIMLDKGKKKLQILNLQCEFTNEENKYLKTQVAKLKTEIRTKVQDAALDVGQLMEVVDGTSAIVRSSVDYYNYYVQILPGVDKELLKTNSSVAITNNNSHITDVLPHSHDNKISLITSENAPNISYSDIGGLDEQKRELTEVVDLSITNLDLFKKIGIDPPKGVLMYGPPGCGKTMLAKAVAHHTKAAFININGSEFAKKYLGEGPRMVREVFQIARDNAPAILFIDEIDCIATNRSNAYSHGCDREINRVLIELLNQLDGFDENVNVKVIMATNRVESLDPALLRPGRLDRKIEFPFPDKSQKKLIFSTITKKMNLSEDIDFDHFLARNDSISCADINAICMEAGMCAIRNGRDVVRTEDFERGYSTVVKKSEELLDFYQ